MPYPFSCQVTIFTWACRVEITCCGLLFAPISTCSLQLIEHCVWVHRATRSRLCRILPDRWLYSRSLNGATWNDLLACPALAIVNGALWGLLRGAPTLRLTGDYFAIVTFGFAELLFRIVKNEEWLIGGPNGLVRDIPPPAIFGVVFNQNWHNYYHILILLTLVIFITYRLQHSRVGRAWVAIREDEQAAESMGIDVSRYKALAFTVSAAIGALGGAFVAQFQVNISAPFFEFWESIFILCMVVLGGMGSIRAQ